MSRIFVALSLLVLLAGCDSAPCDEAAGKMRACLEQLNCNNTDPLDRPKCTKAQSDGADALDKLESLPCTAEVEQTADQINACSPNPGDFCNCF